jgi:hypothetical protein
MNERIRALLEEAGFVGYGEESGAYNIPAPAFEGRMEKFAELIVKEVLSKIDDEGFEVYKPVVEAVKKHFGVE